MEHPEYRPTRADFSDQEEWLRYCLEGGIDPLDDPELRETYPSGGELWGQIFCALYGRTPEARGRILDATDCSGALSLDEFRAGYNAVAFVGCLGMFMNTLVTVTWPTVGLASDEAVEHAQWRFLRGVDAFFASRGVWAGWVWVTERGRRRGLHTHLIAHVPITVMLQFRQWCLKEVAEIAPQALLETPESKTIDFQYRLRPSNTHWAGFRYLFKGLNPRLAVRDSRTGEHTQLATILGLVPKPQGAVTGARSGVSASLSDEAISEWLANNEYNGFLPLDEALASGRLYPEPGLKVGDGAKPVTRETWRRAPLPASSGLGSDRAHFLPIENAKRIYEAVRIFNSNFGLIYNAHVTLTYRPLGITDPKEAAALLSLFNQAANRWVAKQSLEMAHPHWKYAYVYVHEHARDQGLHTHVLAFVPEFGSLHREFRPWALGWVRRRFQVSEEAARTALHVKVRTTWNLTEAVRRQWFWVAYILKSVEPAYRLIESGRRVWLADLLRIEPKFRRPTWPPGCAQRSGMSQNITWSAERWEAVPACGLIEEVLRGGDIGEYQRRQDEARRAEEHVKIVRVLQTLEI